MTQPASRAPAMPELLTRHQVAAYLGCHVRELPGLCKRFKIPFVAAGRERRYSPASVALLVDALERRSVGEKPRKKSSGWTGKHYFADSA